MQFIRVTSTVVLFLLFGMIVPGHAQRDQQDEKQGHLGERQRRQQQGAPKSAQKQRPQEQPQRSQVRAQQRKNQPQERRGQPARQPQQRVQQTQQQEQGQRSWQARQEQQPRRTRQQAVAWQRERGWLKQGSWRGISTWQQGRAHRWESEHRTWAQRGGYGGYYIPPARFRLYFGSQHWFQIYRRPTIYMGYPRFWHGGFSFLLLDPWPEYWAENWYETDDVYIDYDDGYYLYHRRHPGVRLAITVVL